jgi:hypothetical protein
MVRGGVGYGGDGMLERAGSWLARGAEAIGGAAREPARPAAASKRVLLC